MRTRHQHRTHRWAILAAFVAIAAATKPARAQDAQTPPCASDSAFKALDFWVGSWNVVDSTGANVGTNKIEKILGGCAVTELWHEPDGSEGRSLFYFVASQRQWKQVWVTPMALVPGGLKEKHLIAQGPGMVRFQGEIIGPRGGLILDRTTLTKMKDGRVRQVIEISRDGGTTWRVNFDAIYVSKSQ
jgi:hypothetical protein